MNQKWIVHIGFAIATASVALAQETAKDLVGENHETSVAERTKLPSPVEQRYRLRPGDSFDVDFTLTPEFNQMVSVQPDGYGTLKAVGTIPVQGKTIPELTEAIRTAYAPVLHDPRIVIVLKDFDKPYFIASGHVTRPGKYDLRSDLRVTEALAVAGGVTEKGKISEIVLYRRTADGLVEGRVLNIKKLLASKNLTDDPRLQPGDMLYVPQNISSHIKPYLPTTSVGAYYSPIPY